MMQSVRKLSVAAAAFAALGLSTSTLADPPGGMHGRMGDGPMMPGGMAALGKGPGKPEFHDLWRLDINDEQRRKINAIHDELHKKHWEAMGRVHEQQTRLRDLYDVDGAYDAKKIGAAFGEIGKLRAQMVEAEIDAFNRAVALLAPEQKHQLKQLAEQPAPAGGCGRMGQGRHGGGMGHGPGMHHGPMGGMGPGQGPAP